MGYRKRNGHKRQGPPFIKYYYHMINGKAYQALKPSSAMALPYFLAKVKLPDNDPDKWTSTFSLSYREAKEYGFSNGTFASVIRDLVAKGFLDPYKKGGLRGDGRSCNRFTLSTRWEKYGKSEFEEKRWESFC